MIVRERVGRVEVLRLDRPPLHLVGAALVDAVREAFASLDPASRALVFVCGGGGADVRELAALTPATARTFITTLHEACRAPREAGVPVVAVVDGPCLGAHLELAAACDLRVCSPRSVFGMPEVKVGVPSVIDAFWLPLLCGWGRAQRLVLTGEILDAEEAVRIGLVHEVADRPEAEAIALAAELAELSPVALREQKVVTRAWTDGWYERAVDASVEAFVRAIGAPETTEALTAFLEKRPAVF